MGQERVLDKWVGLFRLGFGFYMFLGFGLGLGFDSWVLCNGLNNYNNIVYIINILIIKINIIMIIIQI